MSEQIGGLNTDAIELSMLNRKQTDSILVHKPEYTLPDNEDLLDRLNACNKLFEDGKMTAMKFSSLILLGLVLTPREGVLDTGRCSLSSAFDRCSFVFSFSDAKNYLDIDTYSNSCYR